MNKKLILSTAIAAASLMGTAQAEVKIGFLGGFTGPIESLTPPIFAGAKLAVAQINVEGGLFSSGEILEMPSADTTCVDASAASNGADRLINSDGVIAIVGALCSGSTIAASNNVAVPAGVPMISPASTSPAVTGLDDNDLVFRTAPSDAYQGEMLAKLLEAKGIDDIAITYVNNDYGKGLADALVGAFNGNVAANEAHEDGKADYRAELGSLASTGAETLVVLAYADGSGQTILRQAYESGDFGRFVGGDGMVGQNLIDAVGADVLDGMIATKPGIPEIAGQSVYADAMTSLGQDPSAVFAGQAYDAAFILALAIESKGSTDTEGLSEAIRMVSTAPGEVILPGEWAKAKAALAAGKDINYEGASGNHEFDANGDVPGMIVEMVVENGAFVQKSILK
ncbi:ABC transporter substrate-binding protein [Reinekea marina]|uniref:ABC transporter substrate-binding protein n=1 Tax=Reinekea marina TaxID=1310421 RepID=A0ABV7WTR8_9GAMM|nr:ABC transporter substrate-binding protein [Reinekea marina]MBU2862646.1 ABC transporter substrate-binding protein [Reinekea forsetii]MDN3648875.1 ABC transporter substrate-binding protein [Reinekea marina]